MRRLAGILCLWLGLTAMGSIAAGADASPEALLGAGAWVQAERRASAILDSIGLAPPDSAAPAAHLIDRCLRVRIDVDPPSDSLSFRLADRAVTAHVRDRDPAAEVKSRLNRAILRLEVDDLAGAREDLSRARDLVQATSGDSSLDAAAIRLAAARVALKGADFNVALAEGAWAAGIRTRLLGPGDSETLRARLLLASTRRVKNDFAAAAALIDSIEAALDPAWPVDHPLRAVTRLERGMILWRQSRFEEARVDLDAGVVLTERCFGADHPRVADALFRRSFLETETGDLAEAHADLNRAQEIFDRTHGADHPKSLANANAHAFLLFNMGDYSAVETLAARVVEARRRIAPGSYGLGETLSILASAEAQLGRTERALAHYDEAIEVQEKVLGPEHGNLAMSLRYRGGLLVSIGEVSRGATDLERALAIQQKGLGPMHTRLAYTLDDLAIARLRAGSVAEARRLHERALGIRRAAFGADHPEVATSLMKLARLDYDAGERDSALVLALRSEESGRNHLRREARALTDQEALRMADARIRGLDLLATLAADSIGLSPDDRRAVFDAVIRTRGLILEEMTSRGRRATADARGDAAPKSEGRAKLGLAEVAAALPPGSVLVSELAYMHRDGAGSLQRGEGDRHAAYLAFVLRAGDPTVDVVGLGAVAEVDAAIRRWLGRAGTDPGADPAAAMRAEAACRADGEVVRKLLWDPLVPYLGQAERVFLVPDGALSLVKLAALPDGAGKFLVDDGPLFHLLTVERDLVPEPAAEHRGRGLLAFGAPDFDQRETSPDDLPLAGIYRGAHPSCLDREEIRFDPLPGAADELIRVAERWDASGITSDRPGAAPARGKAKRVIGAEATEDALRRLAPGRAVVHLATHGFVLGDSCRAVSAGQRGIGGVVPASRPASPAASPSPKSGPAAASATPVRPERPFPEIEESRYVLSGLALAGANRRDESEPGEDDGILTAEEASTLDLADVDWVVLSGCDTGLGRTLSYNEGIEGLRRGFRVAGARCVIMSLWPIGDRATASWMESLYIARFRDGLDTGAAVRAADRSVLAERRKRGDSTHPFFWAAFISEGDWR